MEPDGIGVDAMDRWMEASILPCLPRIDGLFHRRRNNPPDVRATNRSMEEPPSPTTSDTPSVGGRPGPDGSNAPPTPTHEECHAVETESRDVRPGADTTSTSGTHPEEQKVDRANESEREQMEKEGTDRTNDGHDAVGASELDNITTETIGGSARVKLSPEVRERENHGRL